MTTNEQKPALARCPFCGSSKVYVRLYNQPSVCCEICLSMGPATVRRLNKDNQSELEIEAAKRWNKRVDYSHKITLSDQPPSRPRIVCLCGSGRFREAFEAAEYHETLAGKIVLTIGCNTHDVARSDELKHHKPMLDELHKRKIDFADEVLVLNIGGYIGESTRSEIEYAETHGKPVHYLEPKGHQIQ